MCNECKRIACIKQLAHRLALNLIKEQICACRQKKQYSSIYTLSVWYFCAEQHFKTVNITSKCERKKGHDSTMKKSKNVQFSGVRHFSFAPNVIFNFNSINKICWFCYRSFLLFVAFLQFSACIRLRSNIFFFISFFRCYKLNLNYSTSVICNEQWLIDRCRYMRMTLHRGRISIFIFNFSCHYVFASLLLCIAHAQYHRVHQMYANPERKIEFDFKWF